MRQRWLPLSGLAYGAASLRLGASLRWVGLTLVSAAAGLGGFITNALLAVALALGALSWRLDAGPLDISTAARDLLLKQGVQIGNASIHWAGAGHRAIDVALTDIAVPGASLSAANISLGVNGLRRGESEPFDVTLTGLRLRLKRDASGKIELPGVPSGAGGGDATLGGLQHIRIVDARVTIDDAQAGVIEAAGSLEAARNTGGIEGTAQLQISRSGTTAALTATATSTDRATLITAVLQPLQVGPLLTSLPHIAGTQGHLGGRATLTLSPSMAPVALMLDATMGDGQLVIDSVPVRFSTLSTSFSAVWDEGGMRPSRVEVAEASAMVAAPSGALTTARLSGEIDRNGERLSATGTLRLDRMALGDLAYFWPEPWGGDARPWIVENITGGTARDGQARFAASINTDGSDLAIPQLDVRLLGEDVTIAWLSPVPPVQHAQAILTMSGPDVLEIAVPTARQGAISLRRGTIRITGLSVKDQNLSVAADIADSNVPEVLTLLKHPRLHLLSDHPLPIQRPAGTVRGRLEVTLPLEKDLQFEQVGIHSLGQLAGLRLGGLVAGRDLDNGAIAFDVTQDGLRASGDALVAGMPSKVAVTMDFRPLSPGQVTQTATVQGRATAKQLTAAGLDVSRVMTGGALGISAQLTEREKQGTTIDVQADLREAQLQLLGWRKAVGRPARANASLLVEKDHLVAIRSIHAEGPAMLVEARAEVTDDQPSRLVLSQLHLGPTRATGVIDFPAGAGDALRVQLAGPVLDVSDMLGGGGDLSGGKKDPFAIDLRFDTVILAGGARFNGVTAQAAHNGTRLQSLRLQTAGPERVQAVLAAQGNGRKLSVRIADAGAVLTALDVTDVLAGGALAIEAQYDDRNPAEPLAGTIDLSEFHVRDAPVVGKLLQAVSLYGIPEAVSGPGLKFSRLIAPFVYGGQKMFLGESQAFSSSLGLTAKGVIDLRQNTLDLTGTIVPLYVLNSALGRVPVIGPLFSPEKGGGLIAVTFGVHGPAANPSVLVNPLSLITPGLARRVFRLFN